MANLSSKTKFVNIVVRKKAPFKISDKHDSLIRWLKENCELYVGIYHKHDVNLEGEVENEHLHLVLTLKDRKLLSTTLNSFTSALQLTTLGVMIDRVNSYEGSIQYLLHKNDKNKTKHDFEELFYNYDESELRTIIECDCDSLTPSRLYEIVKDSKYNFDIISCLGLNKYNQYRKIIIDIKEDLIKKAHEEELKKIKERNKLLLNEGSKA